MKTSRTRPDWWTPDIALRAAATDAATTRLEATEGDTREVPGEFGPTVDDTLPSRRGTSAIVGLFSIHPICIHEPRTPNIFCSTVELQPWLRNERGIKVTINADNPNSKDAITTLLRSKFIVSSIFIQNF